MKAILEFDLYEDREQFDNAINGRKWRIVIEDLDNWLRENTKYASDEVPKQYIKGLEDVRDKIRELVFDNGLQL